jgi:RecA-family ATPase
MRQYGLSNGDLPKLYVIGADQWGLPLLRTAGGAAVIHEVGWSTLTSELDRFQPDVLIIDPLINAMGGVAVNENSGAGLLMGKLAALAATRRIAVMVAHHASKGRDLKSAESAMGAASLTNLSRIVLAIEPLDPKDAGRIGLPSWESTSVFRVVGTKQNYSRPDKATGGFGSEPLKLKTRATTVRYWR